MRPSVESKSAVSDQDILDLRPFNNLAPEEQEKFIAEKQERINNYFAKFSPRKQNIWPKIEAKKPVGSSNPHLQQQKHSPV